MAAPNAEPLPINLDDLPAGTHDDVKAFLVDADAQGWVVHKQDPYKWRLWCTCEQPRQHQTWFNIAPKFEDYVTDTRDRLARTTCWEEGQA